MFLFCWAFHHALLILNASGRAGGPYVTTCGSVISQNHNKHVVNRLKIPESLSTLLFHPWSEVPSRGGVHDDSPYEKLPALQRCHLSVFSECCFLELLARPFSIRTLLLSGFVVLLAFCSSQSGFHRVPFKFDWFILGLLLFLWPCSVYLLLLVFLFCPAFHEAPLILSASFGVWGGGGGGVHTHSWTQLFLWFWFWLAFPSVSLLLVLLFWSSPHVTGCGWVISHKIVNRFTTTGSRSPRVSPHYCFTGGVKFPQGEGSVVIHPMKNYLLYKDATCLCCPSAAF